MPQRLLNPAGRLLPLAALLFLAPAAWVQAKKTPQGVQARPSATTTEAKALPAGASESWWSSVQRQIQLSEYEPHVQDGAPQAPNRAQELRIHWTEEGVLLSPRSGDGAWSLSLNLRAWGRPGALLAAGKGAPRAEGQRVASGRGAGLTEWYVNEPRGLEQGFTLETPPAGDREAGLLLELAMGGNLVARLARDAGSVEFFTQAGAPALRYSQLVAKDANGRELPSWMELGASGSLLLRVRDAGAVYPLTIDPLATSAAWTVESNQVGAQFGYSVATAGDVNGDGYSDVIVGAYQYSNGQSGEGRAFLYLGGAAGLATTAAWTAESDQAGAQFGNSVATAGDVNGDGYSDVIVGAYLYSNGQPNEGRAYLYLGSASGLAQSAAWTAESDQDSASFGYSVATAGDVNGDGYSDVIVGAYLYDNGQTNEGRAYLYLGSASGLAQSAAWTAESDQDSAFFGNSVATAGDANGDGYSDVIVGAYNYSNGQGGEGRAYLYLGSASGLATSATWTAESDQASAQFGFSVATAGDVNGDGYSDVIVGAKQYSNGLGAEGRAYLYLGSASGLPTTAAWTTESDQPNAYFGNSVATAGDINGDGYSDVIVGAYNYTNPQGKGRAYLYLGSASGLATSAAWTAEGDQASAFLGISVATAGDVNGDGTSDVIVGAYLYTNGQTFEGRASLYLGGASGLAQSAGWTAESDQASANFGVSVATAGDVNGDGYSDVIVGASQYDNGQTNEGRAFLYLGGASGLATSPAWTAESDQANALFGASVATAGDVNGDGYSDVLVGAPFYDNGQVNEGRISLYLGGASGLATSPAWTAESNRNNAFFGFSVATAGDVNGDGYSDVIVGDYRYSNGESFEGSASLYLGGASGLATTPAWTAESNQAAANLGFSVATAGDVNGDGYSDVIVGAYHYTNVEANEGRALLYLGSASGLAATTAWTAESDQADAQFGNSVATAGDVNGDGYSDVLVGAYHYTNVEANEGRAFLYLGSASGLATSAAWTAESDQAGALFGTSVAAAGDINGDGYSDVIVGANSYDNGETDEGRASLYLGSASGLAQSAAWTAESDQASAQLGYSVATAGDVNGDGYSDVIAGASLYDNGESDEGSAFLYYGNGGAGLSLKPQQRRADDAAPIDALGLSGQPDGFRLAALGRSPYGRSKVKLQWEVKPLGTPFNGASLGASPSWSDSGTAGASLNSPVSGLSASTPHHWRARLLYQQATTPFQLSSRWLSPPWNGQQESDLRTNPNPTPTPTDTPTSTPTDTPTSTPTDTPTSTPTDTPTSPPTSTPTDTPTDTPTSTPTSTSPPTSTPTATSTQPTGTPTNTPAPSTPGSVVISQIYGAGGETGSAWSNDFVELFNRSNAPVNLTNWTVQYANSNSSTWQALVLGVTLQPGQYYLLSLGTSASGGAPLPAPDLSASMLLNTTLGKVALMPNRTRIAGLCPAAGSWVDFVGYGAAAACAEGNSPTADLSTANSAQRGGNGCVDTNVNGADFTAAAASSPGPRNSASTLNSCSGAPAPTPTITPAPSGHQVVISQVYGGSGGTGSPWKNDFIELFNRGQSPVNLNGWTVQYANTASATWQKTNLSGTLQPGQYYLLKQSSGGGVGAPLPAADASNTFLMHATLGKVALVSNLNSLAGYCPAPGTYVDFAGYGSAVSCFEGSAPSGDLSNPTSAVRNGNGCADTNNNGADFTVTGAASPGPRNTASPLNVCSGGSVASLGAASTAGSGGARAPSAPAGALQPVELSGTVDSLPGGWALGAMSLAIAALALSRGAGGRASR